MNFKEKKVVIHQPQYFPWLGLLKKISLGDVYVVLDNVQFNRRSFQNRALYSTDMGSKFMTIPVSAPNHQHNSTAIKDIGFGQPQEKFLSRHFETMRHRYSKSRGWPLIRDRLELFFLETTYSRAVDLIIASMFFSFRIFNQAINVIRASELAVSGRKDELMLNITKSIGGTHYISGTGAKDYMRDDIFEKASIVLEYQEPFIHPAYSQTHKNDFIPGCMGIEFFLEEPDRAMEYAASNFNG